VLEQWIGQVVTYYLLDETDYFERKLVKVDARGIYLQDTEDTKTTFFVPFSSLKCMNVTAE
jgi:hypothetical protein